MLFNSLEFFVFLFVVLTVHYGCIPRRLDRTRKVFIVCASYLFYMSWSPPFGLLLLFSTLFDYTMAAWMGRATSPRWRKLLLVLSLVSNFGFLGYFKYGTFLARTFYQVLGVGATNIPDFLSYIVLPVGISFYTFQSLSYTIDIYWGRQEVCGSLLDFAYYISFFPHLVAGPIIRSAVFLPQLRGDRTVTASDVEIAVMRIVTGLLKKVVFADVLGTYVDTIFGDVPVYRGLNVLLAVYAYAYQIYFDFSGYSDIAIGLCRLFGIRIPENFDRPYLSGNPSELWQRWHISLSSWLRDYLFFPLGGNSHGTTRAALNLMITMLLGGLWHGAAWNFVLWGAFHGGLLGIHRIIASGRGRDQARTPLWLRRTVMFHLVCLGWILFRSNDLTTALTVTRSLFQWEYVPSLAAAQAAGLLAIAAALHLVTDVNGLRRRFVAMSPWLQGIAYTGMAVLIFLFWPATAKFIYFQF